MKQPAKLEEALRLIAGIFKEATNRKIPECTGISLATVDQAGQPSVRTVYLSKIDDRGLIFFINIDSGKGQHLLNNPRAGMCLFIPDLQQQVTLEGSVSILADEVADEIWQHRSHESRFASWVSDQGMLKDDANTLQVKQKFIKSEYEFEPLPRPPNWKGIVLNPHRIEFWETGWHRMRQRKLYSRNEHGEWELECENP